MREAGIRIARHAARALLRRFGVTAPEHVRVEAFALYLGARLVEAKLDGAVAQIVRVGDETKIVVSDRVTDVCARRFSIAHELGHFVLRHPSRTPAELCGARNRRSGERDYEAEANAFAGELLMPHALVRPWCEATPVSLDVAWRIADVFTVSILAATRQFVALTPEACAAVFSANNHIVWFAKSGAFAHELAARRPLDPQSLAWDFFTRGTLDESARHVPAQAWIDATDDAELVEHSHASREYGTVLSLLWVPGSREIGSNALADRLVAGSTS